jgi:hypothetical protein
MSNRWPRIHDPDEGRRGYRQPPRGRYFFSLDQGRSSSPIVTMVLILAAFTCLVICVLLLLIPFRWLFS